MPVVQIGIVRVLVTDRRMPMPMAMGFVRRVVCEVCMLMMSIVNVPVFMFEYVVLVFVLVRFGNVQVKADRHQDTCPDQARRDLFPEHGYRDDCANERGRREVRARSRGPKLAECQHE